MTEEQEAELNYLQWFHANADFGPADDDVRAALDQQYVEDTGQPVPEGYQRES